ncbi:MAG: lipoyl(octanoyl) transferase LipB [Zetaproteobacteria bacterium]|nr:lipoyl(octanoyl) transferase LipB [Zetaproteobacteria bacterium]
MHIVRHALQLYPDAVAEQEQCVAQIVAGTAGSTLILTEHPPVFTIGTSGKMGDVKSRIVDGDMIEVYPTGRGGEVTYHGPGQLLCYVVADLRRDKNLHQHVWRLEEMVIVTLQHFGIVAARSSRGIGVWVDGLKIAAVGVRCRKWVAFHGVSLNISPNLKHYQGIVPCGMADAPVTSMAALGRTVLRREVESVVQDAASQLFVV